MVQRYVTTWFETRQEGQTIAVGNAAPAPSGFIVQVVLMAVPPIPGLSPQMLAQGGPYHTRDAAIKYVAEWSLDAGAEITSPGDLEAMCWEEEGGAQSSEFVDRLLTVLDGSKSVDSAKAALESLKARTTAGEK